VTLLNSAVISKVLTGYASGPGVVAATDSILAAIQKIKNTALKMDAVTAANYKAGVTAAGVANGINLVFTLPNSSFNRDDFVNGVLQQRGAGNDYQITGATVTFEAGNSPLTASNVIATYFV
jgi:hypothetical protein